MKLDYGTYMFTKWEWVRYLAESVGLGLLINYFCYRSLWAFGLIVPIAFGYIRYIRKKKIKERRQELHCGFQDALGAMTVALKAGYSMENAISETLRDLQRIYSGQHPIVLEFAYIQHQLKVNVPVEHLFEELGERSQVEDIRDFASVYKIAKRSGGNVSKILQNTAKNLMDKMEVQKEVEACIAAKQMEQGIMAMVPWGIILYMRLTSPGFLDVLYGNLFGICVMTGCLFVYGVAFVAGRRIVMIEV